MDDNVLNYLNDDGVLVEPIYYAPIIPMALVNGSKGIGTGFSTDIMCYNPLEIIDYLKSKLLNITEEFDFIPYYEGFKGQIHKITDGKFLIKGLYEKIAIDKIEIEENKIAIKRIKIVFKPRKGLIFKLINKFKLQDQKTKHFYLKYNNRNIIYTFKFKIY
jgi:DNA topoisomerase-2